MKTLRLSPAEIGILLDAIDAKHEQHGQFRADQLTPTEITEVETERRDLKKLERKLRER